MTVLVGTCSWTDKTLIACKRFYPLRGCSTAEARLRFYASQFPLVEVDSSYYAMPSVDNAVRWVERTPPAFVFNIKAFRLMTNHPAQPLALPADMRQALAATCRKDRIFYRDLPDELRDELWRRYREAIEPLQRAGKLGLVHFQFPPWVLPNRDGLAHLAHCAERMEGFRLSVEFRHRAWFDGSERTAATLELQRELRVVHTIVDAPQGFDNSLPPVWEVTHPEFAYVRLHGRNADTWNVQGQTAASERFNYDYTDAELAVLAARIVALERRHAIGVHVVLNNNYEDQGQRNARSLAAEVRREQSLPEAPAGAS